MSKGVIIFLVFGLLASRGWTQEDTVDYHSLSIEELMNISVVSVSKKSEKLFDSPLSATVITREEIQRSGVTTIMEALRLAPGMIVREQTNGSYDIHVRGLDNVPPYTNFVISTNVTTLVMINNRPIFNYLQGGTFWSALPVDLIDVERIEIVRGPSSTLYGPNAVSGVINIITRHHHEKQGLNAVANVKTGTSNTQLVNGNIGYKFNDRLSGAITGSYQLRGRESLYYVASQDKWFTSVKDLPENPFFPSNPEYLLPNPTKSLDKHTVNAYLNYTKSEDVNLNVSMGTQGSEAQILFFENFLTNFATMESNSHYINATGNIKGLNAQLAYVKGFENPSLDSVGANGYDYSVGDAFLEYQLPIKGISIKPGAAYRNIMYDYSRHGEEYTGMVVGKKRLETYSLSTRIDYNPVANLRIAGGVRLDKCTYPDKFFTSYQIAPTYKLHKNHLVRAVYSKAYRSIFVLDAYMQGEFRNYSPFDNTWYVTSISGNQDLQPISSKMFEIGYRVMVADNLQLDIEAYRTETEDFLGFVVMPSSIEDEPVRTVTTPSTLKELPLKSIQRGVTLSANYLLGKVQIKPFVSMQKTDLLNYSPWGHMPDASPSFGMSPNNDPSTQNIYSGMGSRMDHKFTPKFYGGGFINWNVNKKLNVNLNTYWFSKQTFYHSDNLNEQYKLVNPEIGVGRIDPKVLINASIQYSPIEMVTLNVTCKNLFNNDSREFYTGDQMGSMIMAGIGFRY